MNLKELKSNLRDAENDEKRLQELTEKQINYKGCIIKVRKNDIADEPVDAIVNPANSYLSNSKDDLGK